MKAQSLAVLLAFASFAGCAGDAETVELGSTPTPAGAPDATILPENGTENATQEFVTMSHPVDLQGNTGTAVSLCAATTCAAQTVAARNGDVLIERMTGRVAGGRLTLEWTASSPATPTLGFGIMQMQGEGCETLQIASATGASPLTLEIPMAERDLCEGEIIHIWVSTRTSAFAGPVGVSQSRDQSFKLTGEVLVRHAADP